MIQEDFCTAIILEHEYLPVQERNLYKQVLDIFIND